MQNNWLDVKAPSKKMTSPFTSGPQLVKEVVRHSNLDSSSAAMPRVHTLWAALVLATATQHAAAFTRPDQREETPACTCRHTVRYLHCSEAL